MVNFIFVIILIIVLFMVYRQMSCFDELIESIEYPTILIIYDDQYQIAKKYENDTIKCIPKQEIKSAFERDKEEAYQVIENENDGVVSWFIRFSKGKNTVSYSINVDKEELFLTVIENFDMPEEKDIEIRSSSDM